MRIIFFLILGLSIGTSCKNTPKQADDTKVSETQETPDTVQFTPKNSFDATPYVLKEGVLKWAAKKVMSMPHSGFVKIKSADFLVKEGEILRGSALLDMTTLTVDNSIDEKDNPVLEKHLRSADFFNVAKFSTATVRIDDIFPMKSDQYDFAAIAEVTVMGKTHSVNIPFKLIVTGDEYSIVSPPFIFDRLKWGINYNTRALGVAADMVIDDKIPMIIEMTLKPR
jgi:polyisoprenoid-binding protein YceI